MPPARETSSYQVIDETVKMKKTIPCHVINITQLNREPLDNNYHIRVNLTKNSPEEIILKKDGKVLTVDTKIKSTNGDGIEYQSQQYTIPKAEKMQEFAREISKDGLLDIGGPGMESKGRVLPIHVDKLSMLRPGKIKINLAGSGENAQEIVLTRLTVRNGLVYHSNSDGNQMGANVNVRLRTFVKEAGFKFPDDIETERVEKQESSTAHGEDVKEVELKDDIDGEVKVKQDD